jgi:hypothetical protein
VLFNPLKYGISARSLHRGKTSGSGGAVVAFVGQGVSPHTEAGEDDCRFGGQRDDCGQSCGGGGAV